jgi:hypothetical protein
MATTYYAEISIPGRDQRIVVMVAGPVDSIPKVAKAHYGGCSFLVYAEEDGERRLFSDTEQAAFVAELDRAPGMTFGLHPISD